MEYCKRLIRLIFGLFLFALGTYFLIHANIGLAPWEAFAMGFTMRTGISFGNMTILVGIVILGIDFLLKEKIGVGTILNTILVGKFIDLLESLDWIPLLDSLWLGIPLLLLGEFVLCIASYFYIGAAMGCGPRDSLMVAACRKLPRVPVGVIRGGVEGTALLVGWLLGAKIGLGTVIAVFGIGLFMQLTFRVLHFDVTAVAHEGLVDTWRLLRKPAKAEDDSSPLDETVQK
ncbi:MAG: hypothetical protein RRY95_07420 [Oscillospiraceae bacterium]